MNLVKNALRKLIIGKGNDQPFINREERYKFISKVFEKYLKKSILDVGCSEGYLKEYIAEDVKYICVDIEGNPDFIIDLEKEKLSKFDDKSFFVSICTEVLEHLGNLHEIFDELTRVSEKYIIISLPNSWSFFKFSLIRGELKEGLRYYGLPKEKPLDRHKWFFNYDEALDFVRYRAAKNNFKIKFHFPTPLHYNGIINTILDIFFKIYYRRNFGYNNLYYRNLWVLLERKEIL